MVCCVLFVVLAICFGVRCFDTCCSRLASRYLCLALLFVAFLRVALVFFAFVITVALVLVCWCFLFFCSVACFLVGCGITCLLLLICVCCLLCFGLTVYFNSVVLVDFFYVLCCCGIMYLFDWFVMLISLLLFI